MSFDQTAFLRHQLERGMSFRALCRAYGVQASVMTATLERAGLVQRIVPVLRSSAAPERALPPALAEQLTPMQADLYRLLRQVAAEGRVCPSNVELAAALGRAVPAIAAALGRLRILEAVRLVAGGGRGGSHARVFEIVETGARTSPPPAPPPPPANPAARGVVPADAGRAAAE